MPLKATAGATATRKNRSIPLAGLSDFAGEFLTPPKLEVGPITITKKEF